MKYITTIDDKQFVVEIIDEKHVSVDGKVYEIDFELVSGQPVYSLIVDGRSHESYIYQGDDNWQVLMRGRLYPVQVEDEREKRSARGGRRRNCGNRRISPARTHARTGGRDPGFRRTASQKGRGDPDPRIDENAERAQGAAGWDDWPPPCSTWGNC